VNRYIYYRVPVEQTPVLLQRVGFMFSQVQARTSVRCELAQRTQPERGLHTWMEIYHDVPESFAELLSVLEAEANLAGLIVGARHVDDFLPVNELP